MWTGLRPQQPTSDLLTVVMSTAHCRRGRADEQANPTPPHPNPPNPSPPTHPCLPAPPAADPWLSFGPPTPTPTTTFIRIRWTLFLFCSLLQCISEEERTAGWGGGIHTGSILQWRGGFRGGVGGVWRLDWTMMSKTLHCGTFDKKQRQTRGRVADAECVQKRPTLFSSRKKIKIKQVTGCFAPQRRLHLWRLIYCFSGTSFL